MLVCRPNHRLGNSVLISPLIAEIETLYPGAEIDILGSDASACLYANRFSVRTVFVLEELRKVMISPVGREMRYSWPDAPDVDSSLEFSTLMPPTCNCPVLPAADCTEYSTEVFWLVAAMLEVQPSGRLSASMPSGRSPNVTFPPPTCIHCPLDISM